MIFVLCFCWALFLPTRDQVNASSITKITSWLKLLGKNLRLVGCATVCAKSEVMLLWVMATNLLVPDYSESPCLMQVFFPGTYFLCMIKGYIFYTQDLFKQTYFARLYFTDLKLEARSFWTPSILGYILKSWSKTL